MTEARPSRRRPAEQDDVDGTQRLIDHAIAQGLPETITDPGVLMQVADLIRESRAKRPKDGASC